MAMQQLSPSCLDRAVRRFGDFFSRLGGRESDPVTTEATAEDIALASLKRSVETDKVDSLRFANIVTAGLSLSLGLVASRVSSLAAAVGVVACVRAGQMARQQICTIYDRQIRALESLGG